MTSTHPLDADIFHALRRMAVAGAELRAARARFDMLIRLRDTIPAKELASPRLAAADQ